MEKHIRKKSANGKTHKVQQEFFEQRLMKRQKKDARKRYEAHKQNTDENSEDGGHGMKEEHVPIRINLPNKKMKHLFQY